MHNLSSKLLPIFIGLFTVAPVYIILCLLSWEGLSFSSSTFSYLSKSFLLSLGLTALSLTYCLIVLFTILSYIGEIGRRMFNILFVLLMITLFIGTIPKIMGYLGAYSDSGILGLIFLNTGLSYSFLGSSLALFYVYSPFFFLPILTSLNSGQNYQKAQKLFNLSPIDSLILNYRINRRTIVFSSFLYSSLVFMDYACTDLVGGGKYDAYGKALYRTAISFKDPFMAFLIGSSILALLLISYKYLSR